MSESHKQAADSRCQNAPADHLDQASPGTGRASIKQVAAERVTGELSPGRVALRVTGATEPPRRPCHRNAQAQTDQRQPKYEAGNNRGAVEMRKQHRETSGSDSYYRNRCLPYLKSREQAPRLRAVLSQVHTWSHRVLLMVCCRVSDDPIRQGPRQSAQ